MGTGGLLQILFQIEAKVAYSKCRRWQHEAKWNEKRDKESKGHRPQTDGQDPFRSRVWMRGENGAGRLLASRVLYVYVMKF